MTENISGLIKQVDECIVNAYNKGYKDGFNEVIEAIKKLIEDAERQKRR